MENPIVWALIATLGTWAVTAAGAATVFLFRRPSPEAMNRASVNCSKLGTAQA